MASIQSGQILFALLSGVVVSLAVTAAFLGLYRRAVARTMRTASRSGGIEPTASARDARAGVLPPSPASAISSAPGPARLMAAERNIRRRIGLAYAIAFALSAALLHAPTMHLLWSESADGLGLLRAFVWWLPAWAATLFIIAALLHMGRRQAWRFVVLAIAAGAALSILVPAVARLVTGASLGLELLGNAFHFLVAFGLNATLPALLVWATSRPRLRNVMPLALLLVMTLSLVVAAVHHAFAARFASGVLVEPGTLDTAALAIGPSGLVLLLALPAGWLAWRGTAALAARYRARRFSDMQLMADAWWGVIAAFGVATLWRYGGLVALGCAASAWACHVVTVRLLLRAQGLGRGGGGPSLLLLRVFGYQDRTERLFDAVAARWRFTGPVAMIAGADLALRSIDVDEALAFAHGEIEAGYVADRAGLERRLGALRGAVDPDGRYRITPFFCFDDTWRAALQSLLVHSRVVLMDLRAFDHDNTGCVFELEQLGRLDCLQRCVFIADADTDRALAERTLASGAGAPLAVSVRWIDLPIDDSASLARLRTTLFEVAATA